MSDGCVFSHLLCPKPETCTWTHREDFYWQQTSSFLWLSSSLDNTATSNREFSVSDEKLQKAWGREAQGSFSNSRKELFIYFSLFVRWSTHPNSQTALIFFSHRFYTLNQPKTPWQGVSGPWNWKTGRGAILTSGLAQINTIIRAGLQRYEWLRRRLQMSVISQTFSGTDINKLNNGSTSLYQWMLISNM